MQNVEVVMKSVELESPNTTLRNRKTHRSTYSFSNSDHPHRLASSEGGTSDTTSININNNNNPHQNTNCSGSAPMGCAVPGGTSMSMQRKPSLSSVRNHVPSVINTEPGSFKLCVEESSPVETSLKHAQIIEEKKVGSGVGSGVASGGESSGTDEDDDDFDWEEDKFYEAKDDAEASAKINMMESDDCCRPLHRRIHPWVARLVKNVIILKYIHTHHHDTIVLIEGGRPYMAVVIGNHVGYFVIQFLIMGLFKIIHKFGSVKVKITLETHDGLVPHIARSILSDRFEQDNSKFVELNFQGHVLDGLQKIKQHRPHRGSVRHGHRWAEKSTSWLASTYQVAKSPSMSRPTSTKDEKPPTASIVADTSQQRTTWELLKNSIQKRKKKVKGTLTKSSSSSPTDAYKDHELEPQEFVRMSKKRKSKLIDSLRNKPIEDPYKKAKDLWLRICPPHRNNLERIDLEQPFKKEIMDRVWKLFNPGEGDVVTRSMFKKAFDVGDRTELDGAYFMIVRIHILTTEMKRGDGMRVLSPNYVLATRHINNLSRSDDHIDNMWMDIPLFSTARTIQRLKQKIQAFVEGEAPADFQKIDVIVNATNNHTKDGTSKACLQILFRVFHRCHWVDSDYGPRKLKAILFLRAALNELEQEDLNDLIAIRREMGYGNHGAQGNQGNLTQYPPSVAQQQQQQQQQQPVLNEAGEPVGFVGTSGNVYDLPRRYEISNAGASFGAPSGGAGAQSSQLQGEFGAIYLAHQMSETMNQGSPHISAQDQILYADGHSSTRYPQGQGYRQVDNGFSSHNLGARHVLVPETIQLSTNAANFLPFPNGFQFQR
ncbi:hypothetical protein BGX26_012858 [Mortierella sp. AD094]|nr:hypothetical protein BGX26_012858 [Mortierella sp. AD094]